VTLVRVGGRNGFAHAFASCRSFVGINLLSSLSAVTGSAQERT
jgi:hypothetical protein